MDQSRTRIIAGPEGMKNLQSASVALFGIGGVGGHALEALVRAGIGNIHVYDFDRVMPSNINRQVYALESTMGELKIDAAKARINDINPGARVNFYPEQITPASVPEILTKNFSYAIDAIDDLPAKVELIVQLLSYKKIFISSMGAGNRIDPVQVRIDDISRTSYCPLARRVRRELRTRGIQKGVMTVYSTERPVRPPAAEEASSVGSISYLPGIFGLTAAGYIIQKILGKPSVR